MKLDETPSSERVHIGFFGMRNAGKSSVVNAVTNQQMSVVSEVLGTTTDPVRKSMELLPSGPVVIIDTPGIDDEGELGKIRADRARSVLSQVDAAVLVVDCTVGIQTADYELVSEFEANNIPYIIAYNKCDLLKDRPYAENNEIYVSARNGINIYELKERLAKLYNRNNKKSLLGDLISSGDIVVLVTPIDESAPKGRLILPQQQTIREILDIGAYCTVTKEKSLKAALNNMKRSPKLVITDSQVFEYVSGIVPQNTDLTSFSILFARYKGILDELLSGVSALTKLKDGDKVLISEGCTHHRQCNDIGSVKLPDWIRSYTGKNIKFEFSSGNSFPENPYTYSLIIHCGGCMLTEREMERRMNTAKLCNIPITNYGMAIAQMHGVLERAIKPFK